MKYHLNIAYKQLHSSHYMILSQNYRYIITDKQQLKMITVKKQTNKKKHDLCALQQEI